MTRYLADVKGDDLGVYEIALVDRPANRTQFRNPCDNSLCSLTDKNEVVGLVLSPYQDIYRVDENGEGFNMYFDENSIKNAQESFVKNLALLNANLEHSDKQQEGVTYTESWIVEDVTADKSNLYGFVPKMGQWYVKAKIENSEVLNALKNNTVKGFSLEAVFTLTPSEDGTKSNSMANKFMSFFGLEEKDSEKLKLAEELETKLALVDDLVAKVEEMAQLIADNAQAAPTEEEIAAEELAKEEAAKAELAKEEALQAQLTELKEQIAQIPVANAEQRQAVTLSEEEKELKKIEKMSLNELIKYKHKNK
jgi:hypothetical protein